MRPTYFRYLFKFCVEAEVQTGLAVDFWRRWLDDRLIDPPAGKDLVEGYVRGAQFPALDLYPGGSVSRDSRGARAWAEALEIPFHESSF